MKLHKILSDLEENVVNYSNLLLMSAANWVHLLYTLSTHAKKTTTNYFMVQLMFIYFLLGGHMPSLLMPPWETSRCLIQNPLLAGSLVLIWCWRYQTKFEMNFWSLYFDWKHHMPVCVVFHLKVLYGLHLHQKKNSSLLQLYGLKKVDSKLILSRCAVVSLI